jgi:hypothetical protein
MLPCLTDTLILAVEWSSLFGPGCKFGLRYPIVTELNSKEVSMRFSLQNHCVTPRKSIQGEQYSHSDHDLDPGFQRR